MAEEDIDAPSFDELEDEIEEVIQMMHSHMGRFPTKDEVVNFVWGSTQEREDILNGKARDGS